MLGHYFRRYRAKRAFLGLYVVIWVPRGGPNVGFGYKVLHKAKEQLWKLPQVFGPLWRIARAAKGSSLCGDICACCEAPCLIYQFCKIRI